MKNQLDLFKHSSLLPVVLVAVVLAVAGLARLTPHISNMTPLFAVGMAAGAWLGRERQVLAGCMVIAAMFIGDLFLGFHWTMPFVYFGMYLGSALGARSAGWLANATPNWLRLMKSGSVAVAASGAFFVISNFGVWIVGGIYPRTVEGLIQCFVLAVPFFKQSLGADFVFGSVLLFAVAFARRSLQGTNWIAAQEVGERHA